MANPYGLQPLNPLINRAYRGTSITAGSNLTVNKSGITNWYVQNPSRHDIVKEWETNNEPLVKKEASSQSGVERPGIRPGDLINSNHQIFDLVDTGESGSLTPC